MDKKENGEHVHISFRGRGGGGKKRGQGDRLRKMTTSSRGECEVDSSSSGMISLFLLETDTQSKHTALKQTQCQTALLLKGCEGRENGVNGSKMLLTLLPTQVRLLPSPSCFSLVQLQHEAPV